MLRILIACFILTSSLEAAEPLRQTAEVMPSVLRDAPQPEVAVSLRDFQGGPVPHWIWGPNDNGKYVATKTFSGEFKAAKLFATCDNVMKVYLNDREVAASSEWQSPVLVDVSQHLRAGENTLRAEIANEGGIAAFIAHLSLTGADGGAEHLVSDTTWNVTERDGNQAVACVDRGALGVSPWGDVLKQAETPRIPRDTFVLLPGFQVERIFTVPKEEFGSWVCITTDPQGRIIASDQGDKGIYRITPPAISRESGGEAVVEKLDLNISAAQGMLFAFDSLYFSVNGGPGSGLYRAAYDATADTFGEVKKLRAFRGGGEHGPHALRLSPDGKSIYVIAGNHTDPPFDAGEDRNNENYSSRIPTNWGEDLLLPRQWDANGHARGRMAPGGWIASTDPNGEQWEIFSIGYRNPYDMAFNADGELFAYDADMEWDYGAPWYRPTRVVHATSGSEFGWRSGTGKWPTYYLDSMPPLVNIGPGSPVGVEFGYGTRFPAKYQQALYLCDWTFGTMYAIHITPEGSGYTAVKEEFISRTPLPLTDATVGHDGALYFTIGGRGTQSELFRATYVGEASTVPVDARDRQFAKERELRKTIESWHRQGADSRALSENVRGEIHRAITSEDRTLRYAALVMLYHQPALDVNSASQQSRAARPEMTIVTAAATARKDQLNAKTPLLQQLGHIDFAQLSTRLQLDYLRALSLVLTRLGEPTDAERALLLKQLDAQFPAQHPFVNRELIQVLVALQSPTIVEKAVPFLEVASDLDNVDYGDLLSRNAGYGGSVQRVLENHPDQQQLHYAFVLRNAKAGWTMELRKRYFNWFEKAQQWSGGNSYQKFLQNIDREAFENASENERIAIEAAGARPPFVMAKLPEASGPGKLWELAEVRELAGEKLSRGRNFENGQKMFAAAKCIVCHRFQGDGGATGPDLTQLAGRFNLEALTEAIIDPNKVISDQYRAHQLITTDGKVLNGRVISENAEQLTLLIDPEDSTKVVDVRRSEIDEMQPSKTSLMPADLLKPLNEEEVLDLLAYLLSRGDKGDRMFRK